MLHFWGKNIRKKGGFNKECMLLDSWGWDKVFSYGSNSIIIFLFSVCSQFLKSVNTISTMAGVALRSCRLDSNFLCIANTEENKIRLQWKTSYCQPSFHKSCSIIALDYCYNLFVEAGYTYQGFKIGFLKLNWPFKKRMDILPFRNSKVSVDIFGYKKWNLSIPKT